MGTDPPEGALTQVALLHRISHVVSSGRELLEMLTELVGLAASVTRSDACLIYLLDPATDEVVLRASQLPHEAEVGKLHLRVGEGVTGWVAEHKSVVSLPAKAFQDNRFHRFSGLVEDTYEAFLSVPLLAGGEVVGVINVHHRETHAHSAEEIALLSFIGEQMGVAIARARLQEENAKLAEATAEMKRQLEIRKLVERAKGILQLRQGISEEEAYLRLRNESRRRRRPMRELAEAIIAGETEARANGAA